MEKHDQESAVAEGGRRATGGGRFSVGRKSAVVMCLLRGEDLESVSREWRIAAARASQWRDQFLAAGQAARSRTRGGRRWWWCRSARLAR